jgi:protein-S-isoprenylcysteine O-methyltransferase Ste14
MEARKIYVVTALQIVCAGILAWLLVAQSTPWNPQRYIGTVLTVIGACGIVVARYQLGKSFSISPEAHALVTTGVYSKIRNPIYVFGSIMLFGLTLVMQRQRLYLWIALIVLVLVQIVRARREASVLEAAFGDKYREYRRKTWF